VYHPAVAQPGVTPRFFDDTLAIFTDARALPAAASPGQAAAFLEAFLGAPVPLLVPIQRHTAIVATFSGTPPAPGEAREVGICDALITAEPGVALAVRTADCLPIVLAGPGVVAVIHAGWRGLAQGILGKTVRLVSAQFGVAPAALRAVVGVGVGPCHYPVGGEVIEALARVVGQRDGFAAAGRVDLGSFARQALAQSGLGEESIEVLPGCTACSPTFHSYRRDGANAGRQWTFALLRS